MKDGDSGDLNRSLTSGGSPSKWNLSTPRSLGSSLLSSGNYRDLMRGSTYLLHGEGGSSLTSKLQTVMGSTLQTSSSPTLAPASPTDVIQSFGLSASPGRERNSHPLQHVHLPKAIEKQDQVNRVNAQLARLNYIVNLANFRKHKEIEMSIHEGQRQLQRLNSTISEQTGTIDTLNDSLSELSVEVEQQRNVCERLTGSLESQRHLFNTSLLETSREMEHQQALLAKQQYFLDKLIQEKLYRDIVVDGGLILTAIYLSNTVLVNYPVQLILKVIPQQKQKLWVRQICKLLFIIKMVMFLRYYTIRCGLHNSIGSAIGYGQGVIKFAGQRLRHFVTMATGLMHSRKDSKLDMC